MSVKILAIADLHLGKRTSGLSLFDESCSTRATWRRLVDYAISHAIDVVVLTGDIIDRENRYYEASGALQSGFDRLGNAGIDVFVVTGNHDFDVLPQVLRNHPFPRVRLLGGDGIWEGVRCERPGGVVQWVGWSFPRQFVLSSPLTGIGEVKVDPNLPVIGLLHADVDKLDSRYGPVPLVDLQRAPVDAWLLGHIHKPLGFGGEKLIRYPGSPQALSAKEPGAHGALLLTVDAGKISGVEELRFSSCRFEWLPVDVSAIDSAERLRGHLETALAAEANGMLMELAGVDHFIYDLELTGRNNRGKEMETWLGALREDYELRLSTGTRVHVRAVGLAIRPAVDNLETLSTERSPAGILAEAILALRAGGTTAFLDLVEGQWREQFQQLTNSNAFLPLQPGFQREGNLRLFRAFAEKECDRLLTELLYPSN